MQSPHEPEEHADQSLSPEEAEPSAWEMIEPGRYQPRRIRGSCRGRALG